MHVCITKFKTMSLKTLRTTALLTLTILAAASCKEEEETTLPSLGGNISIEGLELFMDASSSGTRTLKLTPKGAEHPEGKEMGYYWKISPVMTKYDTTRYENGLDKSGKPSDGSFEYTLKDSLGTYTIYCYAYASGYSGTYAVGYTTLVKSGENGSIRGTGIYDDTHHIPGTDYRYTTVGDMEWINSNLHSDPKGAPFRNSEAMGNVFGRYYNYNDAVEACRQLPEEGWRLPTEKDWLNLAEWLLKGNDNAPVLKEYENIYWDKEKNGTPTIASQLMADGSFNSFKMWEYWPAVGDITNRSGLAFIPTGYANLGVTPAVKSGSRYPQANFEGVYDYAVFWTADEVEGESDMAYYRYIFGTQPHFMISKGNKETFGASVRCVRESR